MSRFERLSRSDAVFINLDSETVTTQVAMTFVLEGPVDFERYVMWLTPRLERIPRLCEIMKSAPFHVRFPAWVPCEAFDLSNHILRARVEAPGTDEQLRDLVTELFHRRMGHEMPLWRLYVIEGLEGNRSAIMVHIHHCIADGAGATEIMKVLFQLGPEGWTPPVRAANGTGNKRPSGFMPWRLARTLASREGRLRVRMLFRHFRAPGPQFPFNRPVSGQMHFAWRQFPLDELRTVRRALGGTVTDVVLAILGGGMDRYADANSIPVDDQFLRVQLAANVRLPEDYGALGNELTLIPVLVPLGITDPADRLRQVVARTRDAKATGMGDFVYGFTDGLLSFVTPAGQALLGKIMTSRRWLKFSNRHLRSMGEHMLLTSLVMPRAMFHADGQAVSDVLGMLPCALNSGLTCTALAYEDNLQFSLTGDVESLPDVDALMAHMEAALQELRAAVHSHPPETSAPDH